MQVIKLLIASCILTTAGANLASAQFVDPFKVLEEAKRDRLELDKRLAREAAERRQKEKSEPAAKLNAQRKLDQHRPTAASATPPGASAEQAVTSQNPAPSPELRNPPAASGSTFDANETRPPAAPGILPVVASSPEPPESTTHRTPIPSSTTTPPTTADAPEVPLSAAIAPEPASPLPPASEHPPGTLPAGEDTKPAVAAPARVLITVDKAAQRMRVTVDGKPRYSWAVSTARAPYRTPAGTFRPLWLAKLHYSKEWDDAPMPYSIFFTAAGHAIHSSRATRQLGRPASHGCVRLAPSHAAALFTLVRSEGPGTTKVVVTNGGVAGRAARGRTADARAHHTPRSPSDI
ncbi:L,D-transpeptidase [Methylobacterium sp. PvR107]|uniref:L,D-transpeptidase n=1 Tax=Methylobacterium sp. PvR107 TaxID=2806597 RepID=UPI001AE4BBB8|nr:L,D-transpeptidase [Methylobacterium sp. PvR107]MBP1181648.1 lipoprotein-anchoring transpeptidase ErfK/SrfK [Methylobacterium sp. PvR107]